MMESSEEKSGKVRLPLSKPIIAIFSTAFLALLATQIACEFAPQDGTSIFWSEFCRDQFGAILSILCLVLGIAGARFSSSLVTRLRRFLHENSGQKVGLICVISAAFYVVLMRTVAFNHPFVPDEYCAVLQSQVFAAGQVSAKIPSELIRPFFSEWLLKDFIVPSTKTGTFSPTYWPGFALLLTPFSLAGVPFLLNPFVTALSLWLFFLVGKRVGGSTEAGFWTLLFALASPVIAINSATYFSMPAHLLANLLFCWLIIQDQKRLTFLAGLLGGFALVLHNPVPHATFALPWIIWIAFKRRSHIMPLLCGYMILALPLGLGWSSHLEAFRAEVYTGGLHEAPQKTVASGSSFSQVMSRVAYAFQPPGIQLLLWRGAGIVKTIIWSSPALILLALLGWKRMKSESKNPSVDEAIPYIRLMCASFVLSFVFYLFVRFDQGHGWGFRYVHHVWFVIPILAAYYLSKLEGHSNFKRFIAVTTLLSLFIFVPFQALQARIFMQTILDGAAGKQIAPLESSANAAIVFIDDTKGYYRFTLVQNDPFLRNRVWKFSNLSTEQNAQIAHKYLRGAKLQKYEWGEIWTGESFNSFRS